MAVFKYHKGKSGSKSPTSFDRVEPIQITNAKDVSNALNNKKTNQSFHLIGRLLGVVLPAPT